MAKILTATCVDGVVKVGDHVITPVVILTQGTESSGGLLIIDEDRATYIATNTTDIVELLSSIQSVLGTIASALTTTVAATGSAPAIAAVAIMVATINGAATSLGTQKVNLK